MRVDQTILEGASALEAEIKRRRGEWTQAVEALHRAIANSSAPAAHHLRLAKIYEHRLRDYERAKHHAALCAEAEGALAHARRHARLNRIGTPSLELKHASQTPA